MVKISARIGQIPGSPGRGGRRLYPIAAWWPADHTVTGRPAAVVVQDGVGGRIYERGADGAEHEWVTVWQPPERLGYRW